MSGTGKQGGGRWGKGTSGNPKGRAPGSGEVAKLRADIAAHVPGIVQSLLARALEGDTGAARLLLERALPPLKPVEQVQPLAMPEGSLTAKAEAILAAIGGGELSPGQGASLLSAVAGLARVVEMDEVRTRLDALEAAQGVNGGGAKQ
jgi:hypothetical protein